jgi:hypothetical protein
MEKEEKYGSLDDVEIGTIKLYYKYESESRKSSRSTNRKNYFGRYAIALAARM